MNKEVNEKFNLWKLMVRIYKFLKKRIIWVLLGNKTVRSLMWRKKDFIAIEQPVYINPNSIHEVCFNTTSKSKYTKEESVVIGGDWDKKRTPLEKVPIFNSLVDYFLYKKPLNETEIFSDNNKNEFSKWFKIPLSDLKEKEKKFNLLYNNIKSNGYKSQIDLKRHPFDEVTVKISREGHILLEDGIHRFTTARILNIEQIPVVVRVRHEDWVTFKNELKLFSEHSEQCLLCQQPYHPDLINISHFNTEEKFKAMQSSIICKSGSLIDIGAKLGFYCNSFENLEYSCFAVEDNPTYIEFMSKIKTANNHNFTIYKMNFLSFLEIKRTFDVAIVTDFLFQFCKTKELFERIQLLLGNLIVQEIFLELPNYEKSTKQRYSHEYTPEDMLDLVKEKCMLENQELILSKNGKELYHLYK